MYSIQYVQYVWVFKWCHTCRIFSLAGSNFCKGFFDPWLSLVREKPCLMIKCHLQITGIRHDLWRSWSPNKSSLVNKTILRCLHPLAKYFDPSQLCKTFYDTLPSNSSYFLKWPCLGKTTQDSYTYALKASKMEKRTTLFS